MESALFLFFCLSLIVSRDLLAEGKDESEIISVGDLKAWKKVMKTRTNVLAIFTAAESSATDLLPDLEKAAREIKGLGVIVQVDCSASRKLCKTLKITPVTYLLKHYKDGSYHKDYDRLLQKSSIVRFLRDPMSDAPWSEDPTSKDIRHVESSAGFYKLIGKERKPILIMFYVPWCGHCQRMKPEFAQAATRLKGKAVLAAMNLETPEAMLIREEYNITGYPTVLYFVGGKVVYDYWGERDEESIVDWMENPQPPPARESQQVEENVNWSSELQNIVHLTGDDFHAFIASNPSVLAAFYAPWCGHCKAMKPSYNEAARILQEEGIPGRLAAIDATKETELASLFQIKGYPSIKYFQNGELAYEYGYPRTTDAFVDFMKDPRPPPEEEKDWTELDTHVNHLTDETFKTFTKKTKHSLVMFYAPWCGHCKATKPEFISAAESLKTERKTALAAVDCTKYTNLCESHEVQGYPTILYMNYGKKSFKYMGPRTQSAFVEFLQNPDHYVSIVKDEF